MIQVESLTGVPIANQKLMAKKGWKGVLSPTTKLKVKPGKTTLNLMGTAKDTITAITEAISKKRFFVEDMSFRSILRCDSRRGLLYKFLAR